MKRVRSYLATPAHQGRMVSSAAASAADAVFLDLEDAVPASEKAAALRSAVTLLQELDFGTRHVAVRINTRDSGLAAGEIEALKDCGRLNAVILPKAEKEDDIRFVQDAIGHPQNAKSPAIAIELLIETAMGLMRVDQLAAHPAVTALHLGVGDLAASLGARSAEVGASPPGYRHAKRENDGLVTASLDFFAYPMMRVLVAARAFGRLAIDGPCGAFKDADLTQASATKAAAMGFDGKQVIHPGQIEATNAAFTPDPQEVADAKALLTAFAAATAEGRGAVTHHGKMIDFVNERMARRIIMLAGEPENA
jgi:malyl-CoA/(S)-citramalyl-CoA lyase